MWVRMSMSVPACVKGNWGNQSLALVLRLRRARTVARCLLGGGTGMDSKRLRTRMRRFAKRHGCRLHPGKFLSGVP